MTRFFNGSCASQPGLQKSRFNRGRFGEVGLGSMGGRQATYPETNNSFEVNLSGGFGVEIDVGSQSFGILGIAPPEASLRRFKPRWKFDKRCIEVNFQAKT